MDVQSQQRGLRSQPGNLQSDPDPTTIVTDANVATPVTAPVPGDGIQGSFFTEDTHSTFADTAQTPVAPGRQQLDQNVPKLKGSLWLRIAIVVVALAILAAAALLGLQRSGLIHLHTGSGQTGQSGQGAAPSATHPSTSSKSSLVSATSLGIASANYTVKANTFALTVETSRPTWVQVGPMGQNPTFAGTLAPNSVKSFNSLGATQLLIGAGGSTVVVSANHRTENLIPPSAPFTFQFSPR